jgi:hypothetical protein
MELSAYEGGEYGAARQVKTASLSPIDTSQLAVGTVLLGTSPTASGPAPALAPGSVVAPSEAGFAEPTRGRINFARHRCTRSFTSPARSFDRESD